MLWELGLIFRQLALAKSKLENEESFHDPKFGHLWKENDLRCQCGTVRRNENNTSSLQSTMNIFSENVDCNFISPLNAAFSRTDILKDTIKETGFHFERPCLMKALIKTSLGFSAGLADVGFVISF